MDTKQRSRGRGLSMLASALLAAVPAHAGQTGAAQNAPPPPAGPAVQSQGHMPDIEQVYVLIRSTILTLDTAVRAGNFSVLRDVGAPSFQAANTSARLARIFQNLDQQRIDLSGVAITAPRISRLESIDHGRRLRVKGSFPSPRARIDFDLIFEHVGTQWRLFGLSVNPVGPANSVTPVGATSGVRPAESAPTRLPQFSPRWDVVNVTTR